MLGTQAEIHRDKKKAAEIETIEYLPQDSDVYREWLFTQPLNRMWDRWAMMFLVGCVVGLCAFCLHEFFHTLGEWKARAQSPLPLSSGRRPQREAAAPSPRVCCVSAQTNTMRTIIQKNVGLAWLFNITWSCFLIALSAASVLWLSPAAAGSGVPEVMAYLNGCLLPRARCAHPSRRPSSCCSSAPPQPFPAGAQMFEWRTSAIKFLSCALCVGAGLPVGPEGPMIFLGASLGGLISQGTISTKLLKAKWLREGADSVLAATTSLWPFKRFRNRRDQRDFMTAGCACGVAAAFGSPVGGLLFCFEEVASFWNVSLGWQIFFACMTAVFARAFAESLSEGEQLGLFTNTIAYETTRSVQTHIFAMGLAVFVGMVNGLAAALFTSINLKWTTLRAKYVGAVRWKRFLEPIIYMFIFASLSMVLPYAFPCKTSACFTDSLGTIVCSNTTELVDTARLQLVIEASTETFTCREDFRILDVFNGVAVGAAEATDASALEGGVPVQARYNELATLMHVPGSSAIKHLISRGTPHEFGFGSIITFFLVYYFGAVVPAGSCISSGLFVPMLVMGACVGRFMGLVATNMAQAGGFTPDDFNSDMWRWLDPGVWAMVGAGAFMAGVSRLTLSLAVIVMEMTNEVHFILPILVGIMTAKWTADALEHALYHSLLEFKSVPFLPSDPPGGNALECLPVSAIMCPGPVRTVKEVDSLIKVTDLLRTTKFHAYPVVRDTPQGEVLVGIITRDHLTMVLMHAALQQTRNMGSAMSYTQLDGKEEMHGIQKKEEEDGDRELKIMENGRAHTEGSEVGANEVDLRPYTNHSETAARA